MQQQYGKEHLITIPPTTTRIESIKKLCIVQKKNVQHKGQLVFTHLN